MAGVSEHRVTSSSGWPLWIALFALTAPPCTTASVSATVFPRDASTPDVASDDARSTNAQPAAAERHSAKESVLHLTSTASMLFRRAVLQPVTLNSTRHGEESTGNVTVADDTQKDWCGESIPGVTSVTTREKGTITKIMEYEYDEEQYAIPTHGGATETTQSAATVTGKDIFHFQPTSPVDVFHDDRVTSIPVNVTHVSVTSNVSDVMWYSATNAVNETQEVHVVVRVISMIVPLIIIPGNALIVLSVMKRNELKRPTYRLLANLACSDVLCGLGLFYFSVSRMLERNGVYVLTDGEIPCLMRYYPLQVWAATSINNLLAVCGDRLVSICYPIRYRTLVTGTRIKITCACCWLLGIAVPSVMMFALSTYKHSCKRRLVIHPICFMVEFFKIVVSFLLVAVIQCIVAFVAWKSLHSKDWNNQVNRLYQKEVRLFKVSVVVVLGFLISWLPYAITQGMTYLADFENQAVSGTVNLVCVFSAFFNPFFYAWRVKKMRRAIVSLLQCRRR